jgi:hypothetical protein
MDREVQPEAGWRVQVINDRTGHMASASTRGLALSNERRRGKSATAMSRTKKPSNLSEKFGQHHSFDQPINYPRRSYH